ncbi:MAG: ponA (ponA) [Acidobacteriales bacterium]|nr:ponA (ponA) [Terriglobales bacterium]
MKVGTDNRRNLYVLIALALVALYAASHYYFGKPTVSANTPVPGTAKPAAKKPIVTANAGKKKKLKGPLVASLDPTLRFDLLRASEDQEYTGGKRNIFQPQMEDIPKPVQPAIKRDPNPQPAQPAVYVPPPPPPIPLKFYGFSSRPGEAKQAFLSTGDDVFIGKEGEVINRRFRIVHINTPANGASVEIEDVLNNNKQVIPLTPG